MYNKSAWFILFAALFVVRVGHACPDPYQPLVTRSADGMVERLNTYADGSVMCIAKPILDYCGNGCRSNWIHKCGQGDHWVPIEPCSAAALDEAEQIRKKVQIDQLLSEQLEKLNKESASEEDSFGQHMHELDAIDARSDAASSTGTLGLMSGLGQAASSSRPSESNARNADHRDVDCQTLKRLGAQQAAEFRQQLAQIGTQMPTSDRAKIECVIRQNERQASASCETIHQVIENMKASHECGI